MNINKFKFLVDLLFSRNAEGILDLSYVKLPVFTGQFLLDARLCFFSFYKIFGRKNSLCKCLRRDILFRLKNVSKKCACGGSRTNLLEQYSNGYIISYRSEVENYTIRVRLLFIA